MSFKRYLPRIVDAELERALGTFGAVLVEGPKWCGKTTSAMRLAASSLMLTDPANDFEARTRAETDPALAMSGAAPRLVDEWQEVPKLWDAARFECDRRGEPGQFIFTGSATPHDDARPMHSGTGRFGRVRMDTMTLWETGESTGAASLAGILAGNPVTGALGSMGSAAIAERVVRGGWPSAVESGVEAAMAMARGYVDSVAEADLSKVDGTRRDPAKVRAVIASLGRCESTLAATTTLVADLGGSVSRQSAAAYASLLSRLSFLRDVPAWAPAMRSKVPLREAAKHHMADPSLAAAAIGATPESLLSDFKTLGLLFESLALHDLWVYARANGMGLYHYHDARDLEADAVMASPGGDWVPVEVKLGAAQVDDAVRSLLAVERRVVGDGNRPPLAKLVVVGFGTPARVTPEGVQVVPIDTLAP